MGWADITHPFHPLHGRGYQILKSRRVSGKDTLILKDPGGGTFAVDRDWTSLADFSASNVQGQPPLILDYTALLKLVNLIVELSNHTQTKAK